MGDKPNMKASAKGERRPLLAANVIIRRADDSIVQVKRKNPPFKDYAIPGGFVENLRADFVE